MLFLLFFLALWFTIHILALILKTYYRKERVKHIANEEKPVYVFCSVGIWIRIRGIHWFLGLLDPDPSVGGSDPDPAPAVDPDGDPSIMKQNKK